MNQCVRKLFLLGDDKATKKANRRRRRKFERELKKVSGGFAIDLLSYAIMENHFHLILRSRPDVLAQWSDAEVVKQWHKLCPVVTDGKGKLVNNPDDQQVAKMLANTKKVAKWRARLSDISWYMKLLSERTSRWFNAEDKVPGHFWKGRFKSVLLMDERALMTCSMYVDLNRIQPNWPLRWNRATTPPSSVASRPRLSGPPCTKSWRKRSLWILRLSVQP